MDFLYHFYKEVQRVNPTRKVWFIEDNASAYTKAANVCSNIVKEKGIRKVNWPANSPDLHPIEDIGIKKKSFLVLSRKNYEAKEKR